MNELLNHLPAILAAYAILVFAALSPGPAVAMLLSIAMASGRRPALVATAGISLGSATLNILSLLGVGLILSQAAWAMTLLRVLGALYLLYLAWKAWQNSLAPPPLMAVETVDESSGMGDFVTGYLMQLGNPKAIAFWLAITSVGAVNGAGPAIIVFYILLSVLISFACHGIWAIALSTQAMRRAYAGGRRWIELSLCGFFVFAAFRLSTSSR